MQTAYKIKPGELFMKLGDVWIEKNFEGSASCIIQIDTDTNFIITQPVLIHKNDIKPLTCYHTDMLVSDANYIINNLIFYKRLTFENFLRVKYSKI